MPVVRARPLARLLEGWRRWARSLATWARALYLAARDRRVPWLARAVAFAVVAYAFSPIDLIPDFVPVLGYLDDLLLLPLGVWLAVRLIPPSVLAECRARAEAELAARPTSRLGAALVVAAWLALAYLAWRVLA